MEKLTATIKGIKIEFNPEERRVSKDSIDGWHLYIRKDKEGKQFLISAGVDEETVASLPKEIIATVENYEEYLERKKERRAAFRSTIKLDEYETILESWERYQYEKEVAFSRGDGFFPKAPKVTMEEAGKLYPHARDYKIAVGYCLSENPTKSSIGETAKKKIENGGDPAEVVAEMKKAWEDYATKH